MIRYIIVSISSGIIFGVLDGLINANPIARKLFLAFQPIARTSVNIPAGMLIDLIYGFVIAGVFLILYKSIPGKSGLIKGVYYGLFIWFFRVVMYVVSTWMMFAVPHAALIYMLFTGLGEMIVIGLICGTFIKPSRWEEHTFGAEHNA